MGLLFALLVVLCGLALNRALGAPFSLAPVSGLAGVAALTGLATALGLPPLLRTALVVALALTGIAILGMESPRVLTAARAARLPAVVLAVAVVIPALMLGASFAGIEAPVSTHDGAFHVETIDNLRRGVAVATWYPMGFHTSVAAVLGLVPWLDTASGTPRVAQGLAILAPLAAFGLGLALGLEAIVAAIGALVLALTWTYPYDYHLWAGWPQGMGVLLLIGLWATALTWLQRPRLPLAILGGIFAGAIVVSHGTEVYSSLLGLAAIVLVRYRHVDTRALARHLPVAVATAALISAAYLPTLLGWAGAGGATAVGQATADYAAANPNADAGADWLQYIVGVSGAASLLDLPLRVGLILLGLSMRRARVAVAVWAAFVILLLLVDFVDLPPVRSMFVVTYPWLDHDRPRQVAVVLASLLVAGGVWGCVQALRRFAERLAAHPNTGRRVGAAFALMLFFFAEGSGVSIYKRLTQAVAEQNVYSADDAAAMDWLRLHAAPGEIVANDLAGDAGIWTPYKADLPILLPRSAAGALVDSREPILRNVLDLSAAPSQESLACQLRVDYLFHGAPPRAFDERMYPDRAALERAPGLEEVFSSGQASVFRIQLPCNQPISAEVPST